MSQPDSLTSATRRSPSPQKAPYDIYTVMLFIAFLALAIGCLLLYLELRSYGPFPYWRPVS
ncbi:MAG: hypothetical protein KatS3mg110_0297 [Pirellulaceae bacterium]|nr:MAG: hypothetical protein KatS3mg110_0297 [Pirellulaceae bacterium]